MWFFLSAAPLFAFFLCSRLQAAVCHRCSCSGVGHPWMWHLRGVPALFRLPMGHSFPLFSFSPNYLPSTACLLFLVWFLLSHLLSNFHRGTRTSLTHYFPSSGKPLSSNRVVALCLLQLPRLLLLICTKPSTFTPVIPASPSAKKKSILESTKRKRERPSDRAKQIFSRPPFNQVSPATELFYAETMEKQLSDWVMLHPSFLFISLSTKHSVCNGSSRWPHPSAWLP